MKIYIDLLLFINFGFDFILLFSVSKVLRRKASINRLLLGAFLGSLSFLVLFINMNSLWLFMYKVLISIMMVIISFGYKNIKYFIKNIVFLYISSIILGGFLYMLNIQFSYKNNGIIFFNNGLGINFIILLIASPIIVYLYIKESISLKNNYHNYHNLKIYLDNEVINCTSYLDSGNKAKDPYMNKSIIIINKKLLKQNINKIYVPIITISRSEIIECFMPIKIKIDNIELKEKVLIGLSNYKINIDGIDAIVPASILEEIC